MGAGCCGTGPRVELVKERKKENSASLIILGKQLESYALIGSSTSCIDIMLLPVIKVYGHHLLLGYHGDKDGRPDEEFFILMCGPSENHK